LFCKHIYETVDIADGLDKPWAKKLVNAILRQIQRDKDKILTQTHYSHPTWLLKKIKQTYPDHFEQIFTQNNTQAPMTLRLHPQHNIDTYLDATHLKVAPQARVLNQAIDVYHLQDFDKALTNFFAQGLSSPSAILTVS
jgi:16S rRNA (cytosine967-C5)-methyltransferase